MPTPDELLAEARAVYSSDPDRALELRRQVASSQISPAWSQANIDLAAHEAGIGNYDAAAAHADAVLKAPAAQVDPAARAVAGVVLADARESLELPVDEQLLAQSIDAARANGLPYYAGLGLALVARLQIGRGERARGKGTLAEAIALYEASNSMLAAPSALHRLATFEKEDGNVELAAQHIDRAFALLDKFPLAGRSGQVLREKLNKLRQSLA